MRFSRRKLPRSAEIMQSKGARLSSVAVLRYVSSVHPLNNRYCENFREHFLSLLPNSRRPLFTHRDHPTSSSRGTNWPISMTVYLIDDRALVEQQEQWIEQLTGALFFSPARLALSACVALRAKYCVRPAWLIKRLSYRLFSCWIWIKICRI